MPAKTAPPTEGYLEISVSSNEYAGDHKGWTFEGYPALTFPQVLKTGDYTLREHPHKILIERKAPGDLLSCMVGENRKRFKEELDRMATMLWGEYEGGPMPYACVIVECSFLEIFQAERWGSGMRKESIRGAIIAWSMKYGVSFEFPGSRENAERWAFHRLELYKRRLDEAMAPEGEHGVSDALHR